MSLCSLVGWAFFGLFIGVIARLLWPGRQRLGLTMTMFVGVVGSVVGGLITQMLMGAADEPYHPAGWIMSIVGAILVLWLCGVGRDRSSP